MIRITGANTVPRLNLPVDIAPASPFAKNRGDLQSTDRLATAKDLELATLVDAIQRSQINGRDIILQRHNGALDLRWTAIRRRTAEHGRRVFRRLQSPSQKNRLGMRPGNRQGWLQGRACRSPGSDDHAGDQQR